MVCSFLATANEFKQIGCPNCEDILGMKGEADRVLECTTLKFDGAIAVIAPELSWVAKWQRNDKHSPGVYAVRVNASLPESITDELEASGVVVQSREDDD